MHTIQGTPRPTLGALLLRHAAKLGMQGTILQPSESESDALPIALIPSIGNMKIPNENPEENLRATD